MTWAVGDWVIFDLKIGQIKELRDDDAASFSDGFFETSGRLTERFRPLTLRNKRVVETFSIYYERLREIDGEAGFNYPDIHLLFSRLALEAIDNEDCETPFSKALQFVGDARSYKAGIQGVNLFRRNLRRAPAA